MRLQSSATRSRLPGPVRLGMLLLVLGVLPAAWGAQLTAALDRTTARVGESVRLTLNFENGQPSEEPALPRVANLEFAYSGQSSSFNIVNGRQSSVLSLFYSVQAAAPGEYSIPPIIARVGSDRLSSGPLKLTVVKADERLPEGEAQGQWAFLKLMPAKTAIYVGEVMPVEVQLYVVSGQDLQMQPIAGEGFTFGKNLQLPQRQAAVGNQAYQVVSVRTTAVAGRAGTLTLGPAECRLTLRIPVGRRRTSDPWEDFFGPRYETRPVRLTSDIHKIDVSNLPATGLPDRFTGAVGTYTMSVVCSPTNVAVGEPVRLKIRISGRGALEGLNFPNPEGWTGFTTYPPTTEIESTDALGIEGARVFQFDIVPQATTVREIPALEFAYFDPEQKTYRVLRQPPTPILVRPSGSGPVLVPLAHAADSSDRRSQVAVDIVGVKQHVQTMAVLAPPLIRQPWFLGLQAVPILVLALAVAWRKRQEHRARNPWVVRREATARLVRQGLKGLPHLADDGDADAFFAQTFHLLQEQLGERLDVPAAAITEAVVDDHLRTRGVDESLTRELHALFQACNQQRYAPGSTRSNLHSFLPRIEHVLTTLARLKL